METKTATEILLGDVVVYAGKAAMVAHAGGSVAGLSHFGLSDGRNITVHDDCAFQVARSRYAPEVA